MTTQLDIPTPQGRSADARNRVRRTGVQPRMARYSTLTAGAVFALFADFAVFAGDVGDPLHSISGLLERLFIAAALAWVTVVSGAAPHRADGLTSHP